MVRTRVRGRARPRRAVLRSALLAPIDGTALPAWLPWLPVVVHATIAFVAGTLATRVARFVALGPHPRLASYHWIERARIAAPARTAVGVVLWFSLFGAGVIFGSSPYSSALGLSTRVDWPLACLAAWLGATRVQWALERSITGAATSWGAWLRGTLCVFALIPSIPIGIALVLLVPAPASPTVLVAVLAFTALVVLTATGIRIGRPLGLARPASPRLAAIVDRAVARTGTRPRAVWEVPIPFANAFAMPIAQTIGVTDAYLAVADDDAIESIVVHELGHLADRVLLPSELVAIGAPAAMLALGSLDGTLAWALIAVWFVVVGLLRRLQRHREVHADAVAVAAADDAATYARALELGYEACVLPVAGGRPTHPDLYDRMLAAGVTPSYPRPPRPSRARAVVATIAGTGVLAAIMLGAWIAPQLWRRAAPDDLLPNLAVLSIDPTSGRALDALADRRRRAGDRTAATALYYTAADAHPRWAYPAARLAFVLAGNGRCDDARNAAYAAIARGRCRHCTRRARRILAKCAPASEPE
jgi:Zn-dependent protease with chaperone function